MSYTHSAGVANARGRVEYVVYGKGEMRREHLANGTDRMASMVCTMGDIDAFVERAESMTAKGRKLQAYSYIQSFKNTEFDPTNRYDVQAVNDLGLELALKLNPDAEHLVVTHVDGKGHGGCGAHPHNHIITINDDGHGKSLQHGKLHSHVRTANDALMRENNLSTIAVTPSRERTTEDQATYWADVRGRLGDFDTQLGDCVAAARNEAIGRGMDAFVAELAVRGVELVTATDENDVPTWTYKARDTTSATSRLRRRKASKLAADLDAPTVELMVGMPASPVSKQQESPQDEFASLQIARPAAKAVAGQDTEGVAAGSRRPSDELPPLAHRPQRRKSRKQLEEELKKLPPARRQYVLRNTPRRSGPSGPSL